MSAGQAAAGVAAFAAVTVVLYLWGLRRAAAEPETLRRALTDKCAGRVVKYLRKNGIVTKDEIRRQVTGVGTGRPGWKKRAVVQDPEIFAEQLTALLLSRQILEPAGRGRYRLGKSIR